MELEIGAMEKSIVAYDKDFTFTYEGKEYRVIVHWSDMEGYSTTWIDNQGRFDTSPDWIDSLPRFSATLDKCQPHTKVEL
jgi:hypothetical protein